MTTWAATLLEASEDRSLLVLGVLLLVAFFVRLAAPEEQGRLRNALLFLAVHFALLPVVGSLRAQGSSAYGEVRIALLLFLALAVIDVAASLVFAAILPRFGLQAPRILRDVLGTAAAIVVLFALASQAGLNLSGLIATSTVITAVIGLSLHDTLGNVMSGLALQMDRSVRVGDWIKVGDINGRVIEIRWRSTSVETRNWETIVIPNSTLVRNEFLVLGRRSGKPVQWRRWVWFNVDFRFPPSEVISAVNDSVQAAPIENVAAEPKPHAVLMDLFESYGRYAVRYWLTDFAFDDPTDSVIRTRIYFALKRVGIPLSLPAHAIFMTEDSSARHAEKSEGERERRLEALSGVDFFDHLSDEDRGRLAAGLRYAPFTRGEVMTKQGAEAHWLYLVLKGEASVRVRGETGLEREVARLRAGHFFGEMSLMTGAPRAATVVALTDVECYRLDKSVFQEVIRHRPELAEKVAEILAERTVGLQEARENLDAEARRQLAAAKSDLLGSIRRFFGLASA